MVGAKIAEFETMGQSDVIVRSYEGTSKEKPKAMRPDSRRTPAELRKLRDLFWMTLAVKFGLNPMEIEMVCSMANRKRRAIAYRIEQTRAYYAKRRAERDGRL